MRLASAVLAFVLSIVSPCHADEILRVISGTVQKVSDGDTIQVTDNLDTKVKVRLYGKDAPETEKRNRRTGRVTKPGQPYGEEAMQALSAKVKGKQVQVEVWDIDRYKRAVSVVRIDSRDVNEEMVREGWAWAYRRYLEWPYASLYIGAEEARRARRGLWREGNPVPPWEFRKRTGSAGSVKRKIKAKKLVDINSSFL